MAGDVVCQHHWVAVNGLCIECGQAPTRHEHTFNAQNRCATCGVTVYPPVAYEDVPEPLGEGLPPGLPTWVVPVPKPLAQELFEQAWKHGH